MQRPLSRFVSRVERGLGSVTAVRVGDRDRELATVALRRHFVAGRLSASELSDRVDVTLRARSRADLDRAMRGLPLVWEDLPAGVHVAAHKLRRIVHRAALLFALVGLWLIVSFALALALGLALVAGAPPSTAVGAYLVGFALMSFACWGVWRHRASRL
jgi:Domain of unknown function (DUF1707)